MVQHDLYITIGSGQIKEKGYRKYLKDFELCDGERSVWCYRMKNKPKREFNKVFIVIGNKVRFWAAYIDFEKDKEVLFNDGHIERNSWLILAGFNRMPAPQEKMKGFQGIRYKQIDLS